MRNTFLKVMAYKAQSAVFSIKLNENTLEIKSDYNTCFINML